MLSTNLTSQLDFACYVQVVSNYVLAFDLAMQQDFDLVVLPHKKAIDDFTKEDFISMMMGSSEFSVALIDTIDHDCASHVPGQTVRSTKTGGGYIVDDLLTAITVAMDQKSPRDTPASRIVPVVPAVMRVPQTKRSGEDSLTTVDSVDSTESSESSPRQVYPPHRKRARSELPPHEEFLSHPAYGSLLPVSTPEHAYLQYCQWLRQWQMFHYFQAHNQAHYHRHSCMSHAGLITSSAFEHPHPTLNPSALLLPPFCDTQPLHPHTNHTYTHYHNHNHNMHIADQGRAVYPHEHDMDSRDQHDHGRSDCTSNGTNSFTTTEEESGSISSASSSEQMLITYPHVDCTGSTSSVVCNNDDSNGAMAATDFDIGEFLDPSLWDF